MAQGKRDQAIVAELKATPKYRAMVAIKASTIAYRRGGSLRHTVDHKPIVILFGKIIYAEDASLIGQPDWVVEYRTASQFEEENEADEAGDDGD